jgi:hypothetical protein
MTSTASLIMAMTNVYNMDETHLFDRAQLKKTLSTRKSSWVETFKSTLSQLLLL